MNSILFLVILVPGVAITFFLIIKVCTHICRSWKKIRELPVTRLTNVYANNLNTNLESSQRPSSYAIPADETGSHTVENSLGSSSRPHVSPPPAQEASALQHYPDPAQEASALQHYPDPAQEASALQHYPDPAQEASALQHYPDPAQEASALQHYPGPAQEASALQHYPDPAQDERVEHSTPQLYYRAEDGSFLPVSTPGSSVHSVPAISGTLNQPSLDQPSVHTNQPSNSTGPLAAFSPPSYKDIFG